MMKDNFSTLQLPPDSTEKVFGSAHDRGFFFLNMTLTTCLVDEIDIFVP